MKDVRMKNPTDLDPFEGVQAALTAQIDQDGINRFLNITSGVVCIALSNVVTNLTELMPTPVWQRLAYELANSKNPDRQELGKRVWVVVQFLQSLGDLARETAINDEEFAELIVKEFGQQALNEIVEGGDE